MDRVTSSGPSRAHLARQRLQHEIDEADYVAGHPIVAESRTIAANTENSINDFYSGREELPAHPADQWVAVIRRLTEIRAELDAQTRAIKFIDPGFEEPAEAALAMAEERFAALKKPTDLETMGPRLDALRDAVDEGLVNSRTALRGASDRQVEPPPVPRARRGSLASVIPLGLSAGKLGAWIWIARVVTALLLAIALGYSFATIKQASYDKDDLFFGFADYLALFSAALASGASATVLALLGNWRPVMYDDEDAG